MADGYVPTRKDAFVIAVANWWLRTFLSIKALVVLDTIYREGLRLRVKDHPVPSGQPKVVRHCGCADDPCTCMRSGGMISDSGEERAS